MTPTENEELTYVDSNGITWERIDCGCGPEGGCWKSYIAGGEDEY